MIQNRRAQFVLTALFLLLAPACLIFAKSKKIKKAQPAANPPAYLAFSQPLSKDDRLQHALDRLTFGPRPGDLDRLQAQGLQKWLDAQLHPDSVPENPLLQERLLPLESLRLSIRDTYTHYPPPQMIAAVARGNAPLPDDPELRAIVVHLADRYLQKTRQKTQSASVDAGQPAAKDPNDDSDLQPKVPLSSILSPDQIDTLKNGKPEEKTRLLETIPKSRAADLAWALPRQQRQQLFAIAPVSLRRELMLAVNPQSVVNSDLTEAKLLRAIYSNHQLAELLSDFWFNHFNVFLDKGSDRFMVSTYEREAIRPHVFGKFYDLLLATAQSPAMLFYLDNWQSAGPDEAPARFQNPKKIKRGLNENYGRELLELHTLGVDGGYTQQDVVNVARCFTGWTIARPRQGGVFEYNDKMHDHGQKVVLSHVIAAGGGMNDGLKVLDILAHHPSTAHFISLRLAQRFVSDDPPPALVNRMAETFLSSGGDLRKVVASMLYSGEFWSTGSYNAKVKTPLEMIVSAVRATNADVTSAFLLIAQLQRLGEPLYRKVEPTGYPSANAEWVSSASLLDRMNFGLALAHNRVPGVRVNVADWQSLTAKDPLLLTHSILERDPSEQTRAAIEKMLTTEDLQKQLTASVHVGSPQIASLVAGLTLGSPEFQRK